MHPESSRTLSSPARRGRQALLGGHQAALWPGLGTRELQEAWSRRGGRRRGGRPAPAAAGAPAVREPHQRSRAEVASDRRRLQPPAVQGGRGPGDPGAVRRAPERAHHNTAISSRVCLWCYLCGELTIHVKMGFMPSSCQVSTESSGLSCIHDHQQCKSSV